MSSGTGDLPPARPDPPRVTAGRVLGAVCAAAALQVGAMIVSFAAFLVWLLALTEGLFEPRTEMAWWGWLAVPLVHLAVALWIASGAAAATIVRRRTGWLALLMLPAMPTFLSSLAALT